MDDYTIEVLNFIDYYTAYVLDPDGSPAKLPMRFLEANFIDSFKLKCSLQILYTNKYITNFSHYTKTQGNTVRITSKGHKVSIYMRGVIQHEKKRELVIDGNNIHLRDLH